MIPATLTEEEHAYRLHNLSVVLVFALWLPIFFWMAHLGSMAALVPYVANHPSKWWVLWLDTGVLAAGIITCILVSILIGASVGATSLEGTPEGRLRFLAWQAGLVGIVNLALTLAEGSLPLFISHAHR
jgi:hypothetical protein